MATARVLSLGFSSSFSVPLLLPYQWRRLYSSVSRTSMSLNAGIVGLPNVGKSTLFNAVVENGKAQAANFPFCTIEPNVGIVAVPDPRLDVLSRISKSQHAVPASIEFVDIAGLVKGASQGEMLPTKDVNFVGYTYKNFEIVNDHNIAGIAELKKKNNKPKRPSIKTLFESDGTPDQSSERSSLNMLPTHTEVSESPEPSPHSSRPPLRSSRPPYQTPSRPRWRM